MHIETKLSQMGLTLPEPGPPAGNYVGAVRVGHLLFVSGHGPRSQGHYITGKVGVTSTPSRRTRQPRE